MVCLKASAVGRSWSWSQASRSKGAREGMLTACASDAHATRPANSQGDPLNGCVYMIVRHEGIHTCRQVKIGKLGSHERCAKRKKGYSERFKKNREVIGVQAVEKLMFKKHEQIQEDDRKLIRQHRL